MNVVRLLFVLAVACSSPQHAPFQGATEPHSTLADEDEVRPTYGKADLEKQLIAERGAEATNERRVADFETKGDDDGLRVAIADLAVRRRFIAALEACQAGGHMCPPRLDDPPWSWDVDGTAPPPLDVKLTFDLDGWNKIASELHGRACACRTLACVDGLTVAIDVLEAKRNGDDDTSTAAVTRARECLFRLRGRAIARHTPPPTED